MINTTRSHIIRTSQTTSSRLCITFTIRSRLISIHNRPFKKRRHTISHRHSRVNIKTSILNSTPTFLNAGLPFRTFTNVFKNLLINSLSSIRLTMTTRPFTMFNSNITRVLLFSPTSTGSTGARCPTFCLPKKLQGVHHHAAPEIATQQCHSSRDPSIKS